MDSKKEEVIERREEIYGRNIDEVFEYYRHALRIMEELGFDEIEEGRSEMWKSLPIKPDIIGYKYKDPYTRIRIKVKTRVKKPRPNRKYGENTVKGRFMITGTVERKKDPEWGYLDSFVEQTFIGKTSIISSIKTKIMDFVQGRVSKSEWEVYKEEAEELAIEVASRFRQVLGSTKAIGRSKREGYIPDFGKEGS